MTDIVERIDANKRNSTELEDEAAEVIVTLRNRVKESEAIASEAQANYEKTHNWLCDRNEELATLKQAQDSPNYSLGEPMGEATTMPGTGGGFTMAVFNAVNVPTGTKLYTHPDK